MERGGSRILESSISSVCPEKDGPDGGHTALDRRVVEKPVTSIVNLAPNNRRASR